MKSFTIQLFIALVTFSQFSKAQTVFFQVSEKSNSQIEKEALEVMQRFSSLKRFSINKSYVFKINTDIYNKQKISFIINGKSFSANLIKQNSRDNKNDFTWFGETTDNQGVFFKVKDGTVSSSFNLNGKNYKITPVSKTNKTHILFDITYIDEDIDCDTKVGNAERVITIFPPPPNPFPIDRDAGCTLRLLVAVTPELKNQVPDFANFISDRIETTNLSYIMSQIDLTVELAALIEVPYVEAINPNPDPPRTGDNEVDLNRFRNGTNGLGLAHTYREIYQTDVQILITGTDDPSSDGRAFDVPEGFFQFNDDNAFAILGERGLTNRPFTFTHEIGHLQGARHDNDGGNPSFARGFVNGTVINSRRSIMAVAGQGAPVECNFPFFPCRETLFSNPDIIGPNGTPFGNGGRNNARRIRDTHIFLRNYRVVPDNLFLQSETIEDDFISNHLARNIIHTNNSNIFYEAGSEGRMRAANEIILSPGVIIEEGSDFRAYIDTESCIVNRRIDNNSIEGTAIIEQESNEDFILEMDIYPNPTKNILHLILSKKIENSIIEIFDFNSGTLVQKKEYQNSKTIELNLSNLPNGIYILKLSHENGIITKQIIKN